MTANNADLEKAGLDEYERHAYWQDLQRIRARKKADANYLSEDELRAKMGK